MVFDETPFESQERRHRAASRTMQRFPRQVAAQPNAVKSDAVIRPIEGFCRHCSQREPVTGSNLCVTCLDMKMRRDAEDARNFPGWLYIAMFGVLMLILLLALKGWMNPTEYQRTDNNFNSSKGR